MNDLVLNNSVFESIKHIDENGNEYWLARELQNVLDYSEYRKFKPSINKAIISCFNSKQNVDDHFAQVGDMVTIGSNAKRIIEDYKLSRYACYLIAQNADSIKELGGTMPEDLPTPDRSLKEIEKEKTNKRIQ